MKQIWSKIQGILEHNFANSTHKEDNIILASIGMLIIFKILLCFYLCFYVGIIYLTYIAIFIGLLYFDDFLLSDTNLYKIFALSFIFDALLISYIYNYVTPYRGNDINIIRREKLKKLNKKKLW